MQESQGEILLNGLNSKCKIKMIISFDIFFLVLDQDLR